MMDPSPLLKMTDISKTYPGVKALDRVSLTVRQGEVHALVGRTEPANRR
ncbi:hypothetical protein LJK87_44600 [Paenibacillus sp. P25]|nr:hypothetical protein LJK87_44600 [Paenibacillus sp. P25]